MKKFEYTIDGKKYNVEINKVEGRSAEVEVNGKSYHVEMPQEEKPQVASTVAAPSRPAPKATPAPAATPQASAPAAGGIAVVSPLPGVILDIVCAVGDEVKRGQKLLVLEAMKMENDIKSDKDGKVISIAVSKGDSVQEGATLVTIG